jgi:hypothetical protein
LRMVVTMRSGVAVGLRADLMVERM